MKHESYILKTTGEKVLLSPKNGSDFQLEELQGAVGGYIEVVPLPKHKGNRNWLMVLDEEGKLKKRPVNIKASLLYDNPNDVIVGDVVVCHTSQLK